MDVNHVDGTDNMWRTLIAKVLWERDAHNADGMHCMWRTRIAKGLWEKDENDAVIRIFTLNMIHLRYPRYH